ncbi:MAG TPA: flagellar basal body-associated FliL family protein [Pirellulales bacterium]|jgi:flagellar basal body-associated protein FliL|nr:flagellar basal body-associated FliL family protein [Pirellulales bacterium]
MAELATASPGTLGADAAGVKKSLSKVKIGAIVGAIVLSQCVLAYLYLPGGDSAAKADAKKEAAAAQAMEKPEKEAASEARAELREVDLGKFSLTAFDPNSNTTSLIDFQLVGTVAAEHDEKAAKGGGEHGGHGKPGEVEEDNSPFGKLFKRNRNRFRDQVITIIRNAQMADLTDPGLGLIKRQILAKTNSLLGEPLLKEVLFSDFAVVQQ